MPNPGFPLVGSPLSDRIGPGLGHSILKAIHTVGQVNKASSDHGLLTHAAAMAFFLLFSLPALVIVLVVLSGFIPVERLTRTADADLVEEIVGRVEDGLPSQGAALVGGFVRTYFKDGEAAAGLVFDKRAVHKASGAIENDGLGARIGHALRNRGSMMLLLGFIFVLWSASGATRAAMTAMDRIHGVKGRSGTHYTKSLILTIALGLGVLCVIAVLPLGNLVAKSVAEVRDLGSILVVGWQVVNWILGLALLYALVSFLQRHGPALKLARRDVRVGSVVTVGMWVALSLALKLWTSRGWDSFGETYGPMAGMVVFLMWCYLSSMALLLGVEVNAVRLRRRGASKKPQRGALARILGWRTGKRPAA